MLNKSNEYIISQLYRTHEHRKLGMSFAMVKYMLDDLMFYIDDIKIGASDPQALIDAVNEVSTVDHQTINPAEAKILIYEMMFDERFQTYFTNMQDQMAGEII